MISRYDSPPPESEDWCPICGQTYVFEDDILECECGERNDDEEFGFLVEDQGGISFFFSATKKDLLEDLKKEGNTKKDEATYRDLGSFGETTDLLHPSDAETLIKALEFLGYECAKKSAEKDNPVSEKGKKRVKEFVEALGGSAKKNRADSRWALKKNPPEHVGFCADKKGTVKALYSNGEKYFIKNPVSRLVDTCSTCQRGGDETCEEECDMLPTYCGACGGFFDMYADVVCPHCKEGAWNTGKMYAITQTLGGDIDYIELPPGVPPDDLQAANEYLMSEGLLDMRQLERVIGLANKDQIKEQLGKVNPPDV